MTRTPAILCADPGVPLLGPSGASAHLRGVARALAARGSPPHLAVARLSDRRGAVTSSPGLPLTTSPPRRWGWLPRRWRERGEILDGRRLVARMLASGRSPSWIWERYSLFCDAGLRTARRLGVPRIVELNAPLSIERARWGVVYNPRLASRLERRILSSADRVVAVSGWLAEWAVAEVGCDPDRVLHVPNGCEDRPAGRREATRSRLGLEGLVLGFVGSMRPWHGVERIPALLGLLPEATALVVGDGPAPVPEHERIRALGRVDPEALPDLLAAMDVGLAPYPGDAPPWFCPLKVVDYLAAGVPVVASDRGDCAHLLRDGGGEVVAPDDLGTWVEAVRRQAAAPRRRRVRSWKAVVDEAVAGLPVDP